MLFNDFIKLARQRFGDIRLADLARELDVSAQVINGWKLRDKVPYKYVKILNNTFSKIVNRIDQDYESNVVEENLSAEKKRSDFYEIFLIAKSIYQSIMNNFALFVLILSLIVTATAINVIFIVKPQYTSVCKILPLPSDQASSLQGLATTFGVPSLAKGTSIDINSPILYPAILKSRTLSQEVLKLKFNSEKHSKKIPLYEILGINDKRKAVDYLLSQINIKTERNSTLIGISVTASEPKLAKDIADSVIKKLNDLQRGYKISRVSEKRKFIDERIQKISNDLKFAETALREFREKNRNIFSSPTLKLEESRLMRNESSYLEIYLTLNSELERTKIEEVEKGSMLAIIDAPEVPQARSSPNRKRSIYISIIVAMIISTTIVHCLSLVRKYKIRRISDVTSYINANLT